MALRQRRAAAETTATDFDTLLAALDAPRVEIALVAGVAAAARQDW